MLHKDLQIKLPTYYSKAQQRTRNSTFVIGWWLVAYVAIIILHRVMCLYVYVLSYIKTNAIVL